MPIYNILYIYIFFFLLTSILLIILFVVVVTSQNENTKENKEYLTQFFFSFYETICVILNLKNIYERGRFNSVRFHFFGFISNNNILYNIPTNHTQKILKYVKLYI